MAAIVVSTVTQTDYASNTNKFYRTFVGDKYEIRNWGRVGVIGQFSRHLHTSTGEAQASGDKQIAKKRSGGYTDHATVVESFEFPIEKLENHIPASSGRLVAHAYDATLLPGSKIARGATVTPGYPPNLGQDPTPGTTNMVQQDKLGAFVDRSLLAITLSVTDPIKATEEFVLLQHELEALLEDVAKAQSYLETLGEMVTKS